MSEPEIVVVADADEAASRAAGIIGDALHTAAVAERGRADWATTGGSAPVGIYKAMLEPRLRQVIPWRDVHTWWGDDRFVPSDHPLSNARPFEDILLEASAFEVVHSDDPRAHPHIPAENVHPFRTGAALGSARGAAACAADLAAELKEAGLPESDGWPVFDLILLGLGGDGHILSVFPGSAAFESTEWAVAIPAPTHIEPHVERVTLNPAVVTIATRVLVVTTGASKTDVVGRIFDGPRDPVALPGQLAVREGATWILDEAAAANLRR